MEESGFVILGVEDTGCHCITATWFVVMNHESGLGRMLGILIHGWNLSNGLQKWGASEPSIVGESWLEFRPWVVPVACLTTLLHGSIALRCRLHA